MQPDFLVVETFVLDFRERIKRDAEHWSLCMPSSRSYRLDLYESSVGSASFGFMFWLEMHPFTSLSLYTLSSEQLFKHQALFLRLVKQYGIEFSDFESWTWTEERIDHPLSGGKYLRHPKPVYDLRLSVGRSSGSYFKHVCRSTHVLSHISGLQWVEHVTGQRVEGASVTSKPYGMLFQVYSEGAVDRIKYAYTDPDIVVTSVHRKRQLVWDVEVRFNDVEDCT